jgi:Na+/H+ antiporter NhaD/arsenite permease-like protein
MVLPFGLLLLVIALGPLLFPNWWLRHYAKVVFALAIVTLSYYLGVLGARRAVLHTGKEYVSFILLIGSLFVVSGGIHINVKGEATPSVNVLFLFLGAVVANILGTTGASMLLIRPWLRMNKYRVTAHHVVFFIFIVSNVGGCLTPIGDPPLFLGYLKGIPFWWVLERCWPMWGVAVPVLLGLFYVIDRRNYLRAPPEVRRQMAGAGEEWRFDGWRNLFFLGLILIAVFLEEPPFLREGLMLAAGLGSYFVTSRAVHEANHFDFHPIREVAILFAGIFATMMPALDWLQAHARAFSQPTPGFYYWSCGILSSGLDNAPTYLAFLRMIYGAFINPEIVQQVQHLAQTHGNSSDLAAASEAVRQTWLGLQTYHANLLAAGTVGTEQIETVYLLSNPALSKYVLAISIASVFFGANTYIGNGPNFMVKAIADHQKVRTPGFLGYIWSFTLPCMLPVLLLVWWIFFRVQD